ncbi:DNA mismatch repair protein MSH3 isoform X2 [Dendrobium catenatum]|uniref:DNA mismatch repair protein MSH3 isoform X2 n=1 Tax=Dendrobium catenatum TaxID=906689 RepID=UPI0009F543BC|nr:DNA mismatch repair protein MSH3 isoform X2 [Dendrobium catenatum]
MGKPKQQVLSRFFAPKSTSPLASMEQKSPPPPSPPRSKPSPRIAAIVSFSPSATSSKRSHPHSQNPSSCAKKPKPSLHEKLVSKLLDSPASSSVTLPKPSAENPKYTPLEQQVLELKSQHPDVLLMVEVGYRYRFFGEDAENAARVLGIIAHADHNFLTASVPTFRLNFHVRRLVAAGYKVGVVKQTETAAIKAHGSNRLGPFSRGLSALYTRSTIEAAEDMGSGKEDGLVGSDGNYLLCVAEKEAVAGYKGSDLEGCFDVKIGIVGVEISTGEVIHGEFNDNVMRSGLEAVVLSLSPAEILLGDPLSASTEKLLLAYAGPASNVRVERSSRDCLNDGGALAEVMSLYEEVAGDTPNVKNVETNLDIRRGRDDSSGIEGILAMPELSIQALALSLRYLKKFGLERILIMGASFRPLSSNVEMTLSANTLHQLEVLRNSCDGSIEGSLLHAMDHTCTSFGSRLLKHWVTHPLCERNSIIARLDAVTEIADSMGSCRGLKEETSCNETSSILSEVLKMLGKSPDVQRGITRIFHRTATAAEFVGAIQAILFSGKQLQKLYAEDDENNVTRIVKSALLRRLILTASSTTLIARAAQLLSSLNKDAANQGDMLNLFNTSCGQFPEVASSQIAVQMTKEKLDSLIIQYRKQLGMRNLDFTSVSGVTHLIELSSDTKVPSSWVKVNSTKKSVRYHTPEVLATLDKLVLAKEEFAVTCRKTWAIFLTEFGTYYAQFQASVQALAGLDCLHSLAILSRNQKYVRPTFGSNDEPGQIHISSGRHPVLGSVLGEHFVPNDTCLCADGEYCQVVTGPNMGGKSCYIRQVALIAIMAQVGSFVPASSATLHVLDGIYTRMGASDSIQHGSSTFFEELAETSYILEHSTSRSLVIIDELGRGTSTHDGVAIAHATLHYLLQQKKCMILFVTHYPQILDIQSEFEGSVGAYRVSYLTAQKPLNLMESKPEFDNGEVDEQEVTFLYKVVHGASDKSFGLNVARLAQLPDLCIRRAAFIAAKLEADMGSQLRNLATMSGNKTIEKYEASDNCSISPKYAYKDDEPFEELAKACHSIFFCVKSALQSADTDRILSCWKGARELAQIATKGG